jgi:excisionase family DNA binding protein
MQGTKLLWSVKEAGNALGISSWTIRRYLAEGKIRGIRIGRRVMLEPSECQRLIEAGRQRIDSANAEAGR